MGPKVTKTEETLKLSIGSISTFLADTELLPHRLKDALKVVLGSYLRCPDNHDLSKPVQIVIPVCLILNSGVLPIPIPS